MPYSQDGLNGYSLAVPAPSKSLTADAPHRVLHLVLPRQTPVVLRGPRGMEADVRAQIRAVRQAQKLLPKGAKYKQASSRTQ